MQQTSKLLKKLFRLHQCRQSQSAMTINKNKEKFTYLIQVKVIHLNLWTTLAFTATLSPTKQQKKKLNKILSRKKRLRTSGRSQIMSIWQWFQKISSTITQWFLPVIRVTLKCSISLQTLGHRQGTLWWTTTFSTFQKPKWYPVGRSHLQSSAFKRSKSR